jgi:imidazoleglycerol phosphate dehydratase HisB
MYTFMLRMPDTMSSQNIDISSRDILYKRILSDSRKVDKFYDEWFLHFRQKVQGYSVIGYIVHSYAETHSLSFSPSCTVPVLSDVAINVDDVR